MHVRRPSFRSSFSVFVNEIHDNIAKRTLVLPAGAVGKTLGGTPITARNANGAVFVATATNPVLARVNFDNARIVGVEHTVDSRPSQRWSAGTRRTGATRTRTSIRNFFLNGATARGWVGVGPDGVIGTADDRR